jgi:hypothetical protein
VRSIGFRCPQGHESADPEYCDVCGTPNPAYSIARDPGAGQPAGRWSEADPCLVCGTERVGADRYCTNCGYDFEMDQPLLNGSEMHGPEVAVEPMAVPDGGPQVPPAAWGPSPTLAVVTDVNASRFDQPGSPAPPTDVSERLYIIDRTPIMIGREGSGLDIPIHGDPYVSRRHAEIVWTGSGWGVRDLGSTNGTRVNGVVLQGSEVRYLAPEDVIEVGFFSQLRVRSL